MACIQRLRSWTDGSGSWGRRGLGLRVNQRANRVFILQGEEVVWPLGPPEDAERWLKQVPETDAEHAAFGFGGWMAFVKLRDV